jgi:hypothetical protein
MNIIVPSLGRAGTSDTMKWLHEAGRPITLAVHSDELRAYYDAYPNVNFLEVPESCRHHIGRLRRFILNEHPEPFFWVDDDIKLYLKLVPTIADAFSILEVHLASGVAMAGIGQQLFSNMQNTEYINGDLAVRNKFVSICYAIDPKYFVDCPMEELVIYDDVAIVIHAIRKAGTITSYCATQANKTPPQGGCNSWRTPALILEDLQKIVAMYPDVCSIRETTATTHSQYIGFGLRTAWSKI